MTMCGISGMVGVAITEETIRSMLQTMTHRGPDDSGLAIIDSCVLLHQRLTIIDPVGGHQPMTLSWAGEHYTIVYNGELYNTNELQSKLKTLGHSFTGHSDTETLLHAYVQWHEETLSYLNGIYAFAVWHHRERKLFMARDRIGVKPLFYKQHDGGFVFASEIKTLLAYPTIEPKIDAEGAAQVLLLGPGRVPGSGVFKGIEELKPGCYGVYADYNWNTVQYWKLEDKEHMQSFEDTAEYVRFLVTDAIQRQMVSDMSIGALLSGGLDSSLICAVCAEKMRREDQQLKTFSVDYLNNDKYFTPGKFQPNSDNVYIQLMKEYLNTKHSQTTLAAEDLLDEMENATIARDLPGMADVDFSILALSKQVRKEVKVVLSGECADEIFGGYPWYTDPEVRALDGFPWAQNTKYRASFLQPWITDKISPESYVMDLYQQTISQADILPQTPPEETRMKQMMQLNVTWFMQTLLDRKDRMSMATGLEVRVPFCDHRIAEYLYSVPWKYKYYQNREKGLLRYAMGHYLPEEVLYRKKSPYPKTYDPRYYELVSDRLRMILDDYNAPILQLVRKDKLEELLSAEYEWPWYGQLMKVPQTVAFMLQINFWLEHYRISVI